jgi:hypothetical protein
MTYIKEPMFWVAVIVVALIVNYAWKMLFKGKGKLI